MNIEAENNSFNLIDTEISHIIFNQLDNNFTLVDLFEILSDYIKDILFNKKFNINY